MCSRLRSASQISGGIFRNSPAVWARARRAFSGSYHLWWQAEYWCIVGKAQGPISRRETQSPVFRDLQQLFEKTAGLAPILEQILKPFGDKIQSAFIYGSVARSREHAMSDVDVMVIGRAGLADLSPALRKAEARLGREVNVTAYSLEEFREKIKSGDHFLAAVLRGRKQFVKGGQSDLDELVGK